LDLVVFQSALKEKSAADLTWAYLQGSTVHCFETARQYSEFRQKVDHELGGAELVAIAGSGNWKFSLNPTKNFREFSPESDLDVVAVSPRHFNESWEAIRDFHRRSWYGLDPRSQQFLVRRGQDVYAGFVTPLWLPRRGSPLRYSHKAMLNRLSNQSPGSREVKMFFFKNRDEAHDYYLRGFLAAQRRVRQQ
jgi:hypothetical protein